MAAIAKAPRVLKDEARVQVKTRSGWVVVEDNSNSEFQFDSLLNSDELVVLQEFLEMETYPFGHTTRKKTLDLYVDVAEQD